MFLLECRIKSAKKRANSVRYRYCLRLLNQLQKEALISSLWSPNCDIAVYILCHKDKKGQYTADDLVLIEPYRTIIKDPSKIAGSTW